MATATFPPGSLQCMGLGLVACFISQCVDGAECWNRSVLDMRCPLNKTLRKCRIDATLSGERECSDVHCVKWSKSRLFGRDGVNDCVALSGRITELELVLMNIDSLKLSLRIFCGRKHVKRGVLVECEDHTSLTFNRRLVALFHDWLPCNDVKVFSSNQLRVSRFPGKGPNTVGTATFQSRHAIPVELLILGLARKTGLHRGSLT